MKKRQIHISLNGILNWSFEIKECFFQFEQRYLKEYHKCAINRILSLSPTFIGVPTLLYSQCPYTNLKTTQVTTIFYLISILPLIFILCLPLTTNNKHNPHVFIKAIFNILFLLLLINYARTSFNKIKYRKS